jgi:hypothetical protein
MAGHGRPKDGVAFARPAIHVSASSKQDVDARGHDGLDDWVVDDWDLDVCGNET